VRTALAFACALIAVCGGCQRKAATETTRAAPAGDEPQTVSAARAPALAALAPMTLVAKAEDKSPCGNGMVLVEGEYCPDVQHQCKKYMDPPGRYEYFRCAEYAQPAKCLSKARQRMRFCIDRDEYVAKGEVLPQNDKSWTDADKTCRAEGKRVCMESEYNFACEGEEMRPYPYGFKRDPTACNADQFDIVNEAGRLKDLRSPPGAYPRCVSPFGVRDLAGNLEEFVSIDGSNPVRPAMKGAYWQPSRNFCRAAQTAHDRFYHGTETGFRCCSDPK
jgi:hypothetical protein